MKASFRDYGKLSGLHSYIFRNMSLEEVIDREIFIYKIIMSITASLSILSTVLAIYLIFHKSAPEMKKYRYYLFNICCCSCANDLYLSLVLMPRQVYPVSVFCFHGLLGTFDNSVFKQFEFVSFYIFWKSLISNFKVCLSVIDGNSRCIYYIRFLLSTGRYL